MIRITREDFDRIAKTWLELPEVRLLTLNEKKKILMSLRPDDLESDAIVKTTKRYPIAQIASEPHGQYGLGPILNTNLSPCLQSEQDKRESDAIVASTKRYPIK